MDSTAICLCQDQGMPLQVFDMAAPNALKRIVLGERCWNYSRSES